MIGSRRWTHWLIVAVAVITALSGTVQFIAPGPALAFMGLGASDEMVYLFRLLSVLVALFGGALLHTALANKFEPTILLWAGLQKLTSVVLMIFGVMSGLLAWQVLLIAGYDFAAGLYILWFRNWGNG